MTNNSFGPRAVKEKYISIICVLNGKHNPLHPTAL